VRLALALLAASSASVTTVTLPEALVSPPCVACREDAAAARDGIADADWRRILAGEIITAELPDADAASDRARVQVVGLIPEPPPRVWAVLADFASRPEWAPSTKEVRVARVDGNRVWVDERLRFFLVNIAVRMVNTLEPERGTMGFEMDESAPHDIGGSRGSWQLRSLEEARKTVVVYRAWIDTGRRVPAFVQSFLLERSLPQILTNLRAEVERRAGAR
jgi:uncharacterized protein YndB with AHSA1/START domain